MHTTALTTILLLLLQTTAFGQLTGFTPASAERQRNLEADFLKLPHAQNAERFLKHLTEEPHLAGSVGSKNVAEYINSQYRKWGLDSKLAEYHVYLPYPKSITLTLLEPDSITLNLDEPSWRFDKDSYDQRAVMPFNAYSPSGEVTAQVVYVNRGLPDDYDKLKELGVDIRGKIALVRYGGSFRGVKAKVAEEHGAAGLIIYSDPADDGYMMGDIYPHGPARPPDAIQRGSLLYIFNYPGDPLTPGYAATKNANRLKYGEAKNIARIPTSPISYSQARLLLKNLAGPEVPERSWQGGLPFRYHVGPGPAKMQMHVEMDYQIRPIYNVIAAVPGKEQPEQKVIIGNHHDAWVYGAVDPGSGTAAVMEIGRSLSDLMQTGWRPKRSIVLAHWDAEEYGLIGSTEWVEENRENLMKNAIIYINIDAAVSGDNFGASAVPSLDDFIQTITKDVSDPRTKQPVFERWWQRQNEDEFKRLGQVVPDTARIELGRLGSGSDYTAFLQHSGIPSLSMGFGGRYGVYHSQLDNFFWMQNWGDPTFEYHAAMAKIGGLAALRFAQADVLPFDYADYAAAVVRHTEELEKSLKTKFLDVEIDLNPVREQAKKWEKAAESLNSKIDSLIAAGQSHAQLNSMLMQLERQLTSAQGLAGRPWFKHQIYAPGLYTGYAAKPLPAIAEAAEKGDWNTAEQDMDVLLQRFGAAIDLTQRARDLLTALQTK